MAEPLKIEEPTESARAFARRFMGDHEEDVHAAAEAMFEALKAPDAWSTLGAEILLAGCQHLCRCVRSDHRSEALGSFRGVCTSPTGAEQGEALRRAFKMEDPFAWPVPYIGKALGDCTPEELREAAGQCHEQADILRGRGDLCRALADAGKPGKPIRKTVSKEKCMEILGG